MSSVKFSLLLEGTDRLVRAVRLCDVRVRERTVVAIRRGTEAVASDAQRRAPHRTGELASTVRAEYTKDGMVGFVKAGYGSLVRRLKQDQLTASRQRAAAEKYAYRVMASEGRRVKGRLAPTSKLAAGSLDLGVYAPVVEHGDKRRNKPSRPFMAPSLRAHRTEILRDIAEAVSMSTSEVERA